MTDRLDAALAARGLTRSRTHAASLISAGAVRVDGVEIRKASHRVSDAAVIDVAAADHHVSRGAVKLIAALDAFGVDPRGRIALDLGASTGGFTQVLRERGAPTVVAVDVGHGQLDGRIRADAGVVVVEGFNARDMTGEDWRSWCGGAAGPEIVVGDLSFISLRHILPAIARVVPAQADVVLLVKPQFEVGRTGVREGLVTDPAARADAVAGVLWSAWDSGLGTAGVIASPLLGARGNREFLIHLRPGAGQNPTEWLGTVNDVAGER
ncbi:TlyA family RNA methyltransferase [Microbacterium sp. ET2]|uniref:TlyA family RNA methyltransferase n=1 Tax=Microbacterium albipurpureum TaxID=3050384 RepID=UPI00259CECEE|nr:TlyA family RNA methyltransferase [Microbacterium sp. ET2 (Ac-2212)]WJL95335.1 TlyA family RNA methyltransferase [Microbacterium sp. ET2 (Ac-2212)]